jgi:hypothetical protein
LNRYGEEVAGMFTNLKGNVGKKRDSEPQ